MVGVISSSVLLWYSFGINEILLPSICLDLVVIRRLVLLLEEIIENMSESLSIVISFLNSKLLHPSALGMPNSYLFIFPFVEAEIIILFPETVVGKTTNAVTADSS